MKHHLKLRHTGRYETDCGKMIRDKSEVTSSRMDTTCPECWEKIDHDARMGQTIKAINRSMDLRRGEKCDGLNN